MSIDILSRPSRSADKIRRNTEPLSALRMDNPNVASSGALRFGHRDWTVARYLCRSKFVRDQKRYAEEDYREDKHHDPIDGSFAASESHEGRRLR